MKIRYDDQHRYWLGEHRVPGVTEVLKPYGAFAKMDSAMLAPYAARGTAVHKLCELYDLEQLHRYALNALSIAYITQWRRFMAESGFKPLLIEWQAYSPLFGFAGELDRYGSMMKKGRTQCVVLDIKSGAPDWTAGPQTAAYAQLVRENLEMPVDLRLCVHLTPDNYKIVPLPGAVDFKRFCAALTLHTWNTSSL
ncbi:MAG: PD-(D/E)XK nuclease family protein [Gammaproteobacteria bacterium]